MPYLKSNFYVTGLPPDLTFKKPTGCGTKQLKKAADEIKFHLQASGTIHNNQVKQSQAEQFDAVEPDASVLLHILSKIVDLRVAEDALNNGKVIEEHQLEVVNLSLTNEDILVLLGQGRQYFASDAWQALGANVKVFLSQGREKGVVVPCFNQAEEPYWLFYIPGEFCNIFSKLTDQKRFNGYWLDLQSANTHTDYILLKNMCKIVGKNIIKSDNDVPLYIKATLNIESETFFHEPSVFHDTTIRVLRSLEL